MEGGNVQPVEKHGWRGGTCEMGNEWTVIRESTVCCIWKFKADSLCTRVLEENAIYMIIGSVEMRLAKGENEVRRR